MLAANTQNQVVDMATLLKDVGLVGASAAATVGGQARVVDLGAPTPPTAGMGAAPYTPAQVIADISAIETASGDELYTLIVEGSNAADFSGQIEQLGSLAVGAGAVIPGPAATTTPVGRVVIPFSNLKQGVYYRYVRMYTLVSGTVATGINYTARLGQLGR